MISVIDVKPINTRRFWVIITFLYIAFCIASLILVFNGRAVDQQRDYRQSDIYRMLRTVYHLSPTSAFHEASIGRWDYSMTSESALKRIRFIPIHDFERDGLKQAEAKAKWVLWIFLPLFSVFLVLPLVFAVVGIVRWIKQKRFPFGTAIRALVSAILLTPIVFWVQSSSNSNINEYSDAGQVESEISQLYSGLASLSNDLEELNRQRVFDPRTEVSWLPTVAALRLRAENLKKEIEGWPEFSSGRFVSYDQAKTKRLGLAVIEDLMKASYAMTEFARSERDRNVNYGDAVARVRHACDALDELLSQAEPPIGNSYYPFENRALARFESMRRSKKETDNLFAIFGYRLYLRLLTARERVQMYEKGETL